MIPSLIGWPASKVYSYMMTLRNRFYDQGWLSAFRLNVPVIAVGNISVGGTGKTPVTMAMASRIASMGHKVGIVSRGYGRKTSGVLEVTLGMDAVNRFGDEPVLMKEMMPEIPVWVGERRAQAGLRLLEQNPVDVILCDDAFQHRSLARDLNILLFDATAPMRDYRVLPLGRAREEVSSAVKRAHLVVLTKTNLTDAETLRQRLEWLKSQGIEQLVQVQYAVGGISGLNGSDQATWPSSAVLLTGLAKPQSVEKLVSTRVQTREHLHFGDHHTYTLDDIEAAKRKMTEVGAECILTTEKDAVKIRRLGGVSADIRVIRLKVEFSEGHEYLDQELLGILRELR